MNKVSVIVPVYNAQNFLEKCIESLTQQTLKEMELIFCGMMVQRISHYRFWRNIRSVFRKK